MAEEIYEDGIVKEVKDGFALIILKESGACSACCAKALCSPGIDDEKTLTVKDPLGVHAGDTVRIAIKGKNILKASFLLYGIPLILFLAGIYAGMLYFEQQKELRGTVLGFLLTAAYAVILKTISDKKKNKNKFIPEIVFVHLKYK